MAHRKSHGRHRHHYGRRIKMPKTLHCHMGARPKKGVAVKLRIRNRTFWCTIKKHRPRGMKVTASGQLVVATGPSAPAPSRGGYGFEPSYIG